MELKKFIANLIFPGIKHSFYCEFVINQYPTGTGTVEKKAVPSQKNSNFNPANGAF